MLKHIFLNLFVFTQLEFIASYETGDNVWTTDSSSLFKRCIPDQVYMFGSVSCPCLGGHIHPSHCARIIGQPFKVTLKHILTRDNIKRITKHRSWKLSGTGRPKKLLKGIKDATRPKQRLKPLKLSGLYGSPDEWMRLYESFPKKKNECEPDAIFYIHCNMCLCPGNGNAGEARCTGKECYV